MDDNGVASPTDAAISIDRIRAAVDAGREVVKHTPVISSVTLTELVGGDVVLKAESLQRTGAFKIRGAMNKLASLGAAAARGVTAGSAGNHAQALAFAAHHHGVPCEIFVPDSASISKSRHAGIRSNRVRGRGNASPRRWHAARQRADETGMAFCHPYRRPGDHRRAGDTRARTPDDLPDLARVIVPLGGGGLAAGIAIAVKHERPDVEVIGIQAAACAPYLFGSAPVGQSTPSPTGSP